MAKQNEDGILWCDFTFNPWVGCAKISPACDHCYAESWAKRSGIVKWGPHDERRRTSESNWRQPLKWNAEAARLGTRFRVFCASLADVFDNAVPQEWRNDLFLLITQTPHLDWLLLTKRVGNVMGMVPLPWISKPFQHGPNPENIYPGGWPQNVWLGATICNQVEADRDIPKLLSVPGAKRFLSMEPLLGPVDLTMIDDENTPGLSWNVLTGERTIVHEGATGEWSRTDTALDWVIVGGESGPGARPMHADWVRSLRDQCATAGVPFFFKQWGMYANQRAASLDENFCYEKSFTGGWVEMDGDFSMGAEADTKSNNYCSAQVNKAIHVFGFRTKQAAGRVLDGRFWNEVPTVIAEDQRRVI